MKEKKKFIIPIVIFLLLTSMLIIEKNSGSNEEWKQNTSNILIENNNNVIENEEDSFLISSNEGISNLNDYTNEYDINHSGSPEGDLFSYTKKGRTIFNLSLVRGDLTDDEYDEFISLIDEGNYGEEIFIQSGSLLINDDVIQFIFETNNEEKYRVIVYYIKKLPIDIKAF